MAGTVIYKMSGSGNDFVFVDGRVAPADSWTPERIRWICSRQTGVGGDGVAVIEPGAAPGAVRLQYFNRDGFRAALCGNASLCAARLSTWLELAPADGIQLETDAGPVRARCLAGPGELAEVEISGISAVQTPALQLAPNEKWARFATVGVPHLVVLVDAVADVDVAARGRALRLDPLLQPEGANVTFISPEGAGWRMRTYERGVEAETLACGTGSVAVATVLVGAGLAEWPVSLRTASECTLTVSPAESPRGAATTLRLVGEGRLVFRGIIGS